MALDSTHYCTLADLTAEGLTTALFGTDARREELVKTASRAVDKFCRHWFHDKTYGSGTELCLDGAGRNVLRLPAPIISVESIEADFYGNRTFTAVDSSTWVAYDDDPQDPRLVRISSANDPFDTDPVWPKGVRNIRLQCHLGYLEDSATPLAIKRAVMRMVAHERELMSADHAVESRLIRQGQVQSKRTHNRSISFVDALLSGFLTGDPMVDNALTRYRRVVL